tara:strand:- start:2090 stop:2845 length:756 start_codon:yes stop_codon:yes gene_type:complete
MSENKQIVGGSGDPREDALDALFAGSIEDSMTITDLPSKGKFYEGFNGVEIKALTYLDEQTILTAKDNNKDIVSKLLEKCIEGIDVGELLAMDKMYLLMKVRELSYGKDYSFNITCPNCTADIKSSLVLSEHLNMNPVPDEMEDPREILLPKLNVKAKVRFPRGKEEIFLTSSEDVYKNLYRFVVSINDSSDPVFISKALKRMHIQDIKTLIASINEAEYGVDPKFLFECPECRHTDTMAIPMDVGFFSVS